jgi:toxin CptA
MSSIKSLAPIRIEPRRSLRLAALLVLMHAGAVVIIILLPIAVWVKAPLCALLIVSLLNMLNIHALRRGKASIVEALWEGDGQWRLGTADGREHTARLLPGSYVSSHLVILRFAMEGSWQRRALVLLPDVLDATTLRKLRVRLLHSADQDPL